MTEEQKQSMNDNYDEKNIESIREILEEPIPQMVGMFVNESGNGTKVEITVESRKKCAKALLS